MSLGGSEEELIARPYQLQLEEIAAEKNTIIHLPTGSGKTFIAIRLIKRFSKDLKSPWGQGGKRTFFLVNTVPLVMQQKKVLNARCCVRSVGGFSGEDGVDFWDKNKWNFELAKHEVVVMTCQILADMLTHKYIMVEDINLMIFDECHHAVEDHPMRLIMKNFAGIPANRQPRILGLSATLLNCNVSINAVNTTLKELETTFHATIATVDDLGEVLNFSTNPHEIIQYYSSTVPTPAAMKAKKILSDLACLTDRVTLPDYSRDPTLQLKKNQRNISSDPEKIVKEVKKMINGMISYIDEMGVYGGAVGIVAYTIMFERLKRKALSKEEEKLYQIVITHSTMTRKVLLDSMKSKTGYEKIVKNSCDRILLLLNVLKEYNPDKLNEPGVLFKVNIARKPLSAIIFTQQRFTAKILYNILKEVVKTNPKEFGFLKQDFLVGFNVNPTKCTREQQYTKKASQGILLKFANKELNCLISTNVIEEGVDIPQCLLVLRYDRPLEYRSYIQSKGRARSKESSYVMFVPENDSSKFRSQYKKFQDTEEYIQKILVGNSSCRSAPTLQDIEKNLYNDFEIPPYETDTGLRLSAVQAISLLNRYCASLPHDQFTVITPMLISETERDKIRVKITMPKACPISDAIEGDLMYNVKDAKRSAALNACIKLHQIGELDPTSLLPRSYGRVDFDEPDIKACFLNWPWDKSANGNVVEMGPKAGTKKFVRKYKKVFPKLLQGQPNISQGHQFYVHIIKLKTAFAQPDDSRERCLYEMLHRGEGYGFITFEPLPEICDFPMFLTVGEVKTSILMNYAAITLNDKMFELVKSFHYFIFDQVLGVAKKFTVFDGKSNCLFVVPVDCNGNGYDIDWQMMKSYVEIEPVCEPPFEERKLFKVDPEEYLHHIVSPWYRGFILPDRYIVSKVLEHMTINSGLAGSNDPVYSTYAEYYSSKYNLEILGDKTQPLLEVRNISTKMNCLLPRAATIKELTDKQVKMITMAQGENKSKGFPEIFVPEFCIKYDFPGCMWFKAAILPSIVHRVTILLVAYELRAEIAKATKIGKPHLSKGKRTWEGDVKLTGEKWLPIQSSKDAVMQSLLSLVKDPNPISTTVDRINNPIDESAPRPKRIQSMKENLYQLQRKKLAQDYDWDEKSEPLDVERNILSVTVVDIELYDEFVSAIVPQASDPSVRSPPRACTSAAILPSPVQETCKIAILGKKPTSRGPELRDVLTALTTINSHDSFNLERVETLGDSFLKFASSLYLYHKFPKLNEGHLTNIKGRFLGNRNLYYAGEKVNLGGHMKVEQFTPRNDFLVPGFFAPKICQKEIAKNQLRPTCLLGMEFDREEALSGQLTHESRAAIAQKFNSNNEDLEKETVDGIQAPMQCYLGLQAVSDKSVADCVEALIGTYLLSDGIPAAIKILEWFKIMPPQDNFASYLKRKVPTILTDGVIEADEIDRVMDYTRENIENILGYKFNDPSFLLEAMSHPSYVRNRYTRSYERLEFLGDAILDFLITAHIFETCPDLKPGDLTDLRSALVNNVTFASYIVRLGLHKYICFQLNPVLEKAIMTYVEHQERNNHSIDENVLYLIDEEDCHIAEYVEVPKILSDTFESLAGAIFLDTGGDLDKVWSVYYKIMCKEIYTFSRRIPQQPVRTLYETIHACPRFGESVLCPEGISKIMVPVTITKHGTQVIVHGFGSNKLQAKRAAAKVALKLLGI